MLGSKVTGNFVEAHWIVTYRLPVYYIAMKTPRRDMSIGQLAKASDVPTSTIR